MPSNFLALANWDGGLSSITNSKTKSSASNVLNAHMGATLDRQLDTGSAVPPGLGGERDDDDEEEEEEVDELASSLSEPDASQNLKKGVFGLGMDVNAKKLSNRTYLLSGSKKGRQKPGKRSLPTKTNGNRYNQTRSNDSQMSMTSRLPDSDQLERWSEDAEGDDDSDAIIVDVMLNSSRKATLPLGSRRAHREISESSLPVSPNQGQSVTITPRPLHFLFTPPPQSPLHSLFSPTPRPGPSLPPRQPASRRTHPFNYVAVPDLPPGVTKRMYRPIPDGEVPHKVVVHKTIGDALNASLSHNALLGVLPSKHSKTGSTMPTNKRPTTHVNAVAGPSNPKSVSVSLMVPKRKHYRSISDAASNPMESHVRKKMKIIPDKALSPLPQQRPFLQPHDGIASEDPLNDIVRKVEVNPGSGPGPSPQPLRGDTTYDPLNDILLFNLDNLRASRNDWTTYETLLASTRHIRARYGELLEPRSADSKIYGNAHILRRRQSIQSTTWFSYPPSRMSREEEGTSPGPILVIVDDEPLDIVDDEESRKTPMTDPQAIIKSTRRQDIARSSNIAAGNKAKEQQKNVYIQTPTKDVNGKVRRTGSSPVVYHKPHRRHHRHPSQESVMETEPEPENELSEDVSEAIQDSVDILSAKALGKQRAVDPDLTLTSPRQTEGVTADHPPLGDVDTDMDRYFNGLGPGPSHSDFDYCHPSSTMDPTVQLSGNVIDTQGDDSLGSFTEAQVEEGAHIQPPEENIDIPFRFPPPQLTSDPPLEPSNEFPPHGDSPFLSDTRDNADGHEQGTINLWEFETGSSRSLPEQAHATIDPSLLGGADSANPLPHERSVSPVQPPPRRQHAQFWSREQRKSLRQSIQCEPDEMDPELPSSSSYHSFSEVESDKSDDLYLEKPIPQVKRKPRRPKRILPAQRWQPKEPVVVTATSKKQGRRAAGSLWPEGNTAWFCHHCRVRTFRLHMMCSCNRKYCVRCISVKYVGEVVFDASLPNFECPACRNACRCDVCTRKRGEIYIPLRHRESAAGPKAGSQPKVMRSLLGGKTNLPPPPPPPPPSSLTKVLVAGPVSYWATIYGISGEKVGTAFRGDEGGEGVVGTHGAPTDGKRRRIFAGMVQPSWNIRPEGVRDLQSDIEALGGAKEKASAVRTYIGDRSRLFAPSTNDTLIRPQRQEGLPSSSPLSSPESRKSLRIPENGGETSPHLHPEIAGSAGSDGGNDEPMANGIHNHRSTGSLNEEDTAKAIHLALTSVGVNVIGPEHLSAC